jgi:hypothetical protein
MVFELSKTYNFTTLAPSVLGGNYLNMTVESVMTAETVSVFRDVASVHRQILPELPPGTPESINDLSFVLFTTVDGDKIVLSEAWIDRNTIVEVVGVSINVKVFNVTTEDIPIIRDAIVMLGYKDIEITTF